MIYDDGVEKVSGGGLTCPCGGPISKGALKGGRERWRCTACGRYEVMNGFFDTRNEVRCKGAHLVEGRFDLREV
jgi:hypothetical protein